MAKGKISIKEWATMVWYLKSMLRSVRPWRVTPFSDGTEEYAKGWNDCLKTMKSNEGKWFRHMSKKVGELIK